MFNEEVFINLEVRTLPAGQSDFGEARQAVFDIDSSRFGTRPAASNHGGGHVSVEVKAEERAEATAAGAARVVQTTKIDGRCSQRAGLTPTPFPPSHTDDAIHPQDFRPPTYGRRNPNAGFPSTPTPHHVGSPDRESITT